MVLLRLRTLPKRVWFPKASFGIAARVQIFEQLQLRALPSVPVRYYQLTNPSVAAVRVGTRRTSSSYFLSVAAQLGVNSKSMT